MANSFVAVRASTIGAINTMPMLLKKLLMAKVSCTPNKLFRHRCAQERKNLTTPNYDKRRHSCRRPQQLYMHDSCSWWLYTLENAQRIDKCELSYNDWAVV